MLLDSQHKTIAVLTSCDACPEQNLKAGAALDHPLPYRSLGKSGLGRA